MRFNLCILTIVTLISCSSKEKDTHSTDFLAGEEVGELTAKELKEVSGLAASQANPGFFWVINDGGNGANVYLVDQHLDIKMKCKLIGIRNRDWEEVAIGYDPETKTSYLYIAEIGDNYAKYIYKKLYRFKEPTMSDSSVINIMKEQVQQIVFRLPEGARDTEAMMIDPLQHDIYIVSKREKHAHVYQLKYPQSTQDTLMAETFMTLPFTQVTAANFSLQGTEVLIKNYSDIFYWNRDSTETVKEMLTISPKILDYKPEPQGESIAWSLDGSGYYTISEKVTGFKSNLLFYKRNKPSL